MYSDSYEINKLSGETALIKKSKKREVQQLTKKYMNQSNKSRSTKPTCL